MDSMNHGHDEIQTKETIAPQLHADHSTSQKLARWLLFLFIGITLTTGCAQVIMNETHPTKHIDHCLSPRADEDTPIKLGL